MSSRSESAKFFFWKCAWRNLSLFFGRDLWHFSPTHLPHITPRQLYVFLFCLRSLYRQLFLKSSGRQVLSLLIGPQDSISCVIVNYLFFWRVRVCVFYLSARSHMLWSLSLRFMMDFLSPSLLSSYPFWSFSSSSPIWDIRKRIEHRVMATLPSLCLCLSMASAKVEK